MTVFKYEGWFTSATTKKSIVEGHGDFVPIFFNQIPDYIRRDIFHEGVLMLSVSEPDEHGFCCVGVSSDYTMHAIKSCRTVIAEVNDEVPVVYGETFVHVEEIDAFVVNSHPLYESKLAKIGESDAICDDQKRWYQDIEDRAISRSRSSSHYIKM